MLHVEFFYRNFIIKRLPSYCSTNTFVLTFGDVVLLKIIVSSESIELLN